MLSPIQQKWVDQVEAELNRIQVQIDNCSLGQEEEGIDKETRSALKRGYKEASKQFQAAILQFSNEATELGLSFGFQSEPTEEDGEYNRLKVYAKPIEVFCQPPYFATLPKPEPTTDAPVVDFWCGGGGVGTAGFLQAGFRIGINIDCDPKNPKLSDAIADNYELNYNKPVIRQTLQEYASAKSFSEQAIPDVIVFTQSCKNLSKANRRTSEGETDIAVATAATYGLSILKPKVFVLENVREYQNSECLTIIEQTLKTLGYSWTKGVLNSWWYNVPQNRERFILIAAQGIEPTLPDPLTVQPMGWGMALADLIGNFPITAPAPWQVKKFQNLPTSDRLIRGSNASSPEPRNRKADKPSFTITASEWLKLYLVERAGARDGQPKVRGAVDPSWTVKASPFTDQKGANRHDGINTWDGKGEWRRVTNRGVARLMGLYDWYQLPEKPSVYGPLLGNGLPAEMARAIAQHIKQYLEPTMLVFDNDEFEPKSNSISEIATPQNNDYFELIDPSTIDLNKGSQTRATHNDQGVKEFLAKMKDEVWDFNNPQDCPLLIEIEADETIQLESGEVIELKSGDRIPANGHTRLEAGQKFKEINLELKMLCQIEYGTWFDVIRHSSIADINSAYPKTLKDRRNAATLFIRQLFDRYGSLDAIPRRGRGKGGRDLKEEWGAKTLAKIYGLSSKTIETIYAEVEFERAIKLYAVGSRIQIMEDNAVELPWGLKEKVGELGVVYSYDQKALQIIITLDNFGLGWSIPPRFLRPSTAPMPIVIKGEEIANCEKEQSTPSSHTNCNEELKEQAEQLGVENGSQALPTAPTNLDVSFSEAIAEPLTPSINLIDTLKTVIDNIHLYSAEELEELEKAIAHAKQAPFPTKFNFLKDASLAEAS